MALSGLGLRLRGWDLGVKGLDGSGFRFRVWRFSLGFGIEASGACTIVRKCSSDVVHTKYSDLGFGVPRQNVVAVGAYFPTFVFLQLPV